jgi:uncharacterized protein HemX
VCGSAFPSRLHFKDPPKYQRAFDVRRSITLPCSTRNKPTIHGIATKVPASSSRGLFYGTLFVIVVAALVAAFLVYQHHTEAKAERSRRAAQEELANRQAAEADLRAEPERLKHALAASMQQPDRAVPAQPRTIIPSIRQESVAQFAQSRRLPPASPQIRPKRCRLQVMSALIIKL